MQQKLRPLLSVRCMMNDIILFENHRFPLPTRRRQFGVSKNFTLVTVSENLALRFLVPENAISFRPYMFLLFVGEIYAYRARVDKAMDLLL